MTIIAVDNYEKRLMGLVTALQSFFPDDDIVYFTDPLYALKHLFNNGADIIFTESEMKPIDGRTLCRIVGEQYENTIVYCVSDTVKQDKQANFAAYLTRPVTPEAIKNILQTA